jgi:hypothetical protein
LKKVTKLILPSIKDCVLSLSKDLKGCRIIQRLLERFDKDIKTIKFIYEEINSEIKVLTEDEFGNYVISHLLENGTKGDKIIIIDEILDDLCQLSLHKNGSNVVEKCLKFAPDERKHEILDRFCALPM